MTKLLVWLESLFNDAIKKKPSSKRILGGVAFVISIVGGFCGYNEVMYAFLSFTAVSLGMTAFERK